MSDPHGPHCAIGESEETPFEADMIVSTLHEMMFVSSCLPSSCQQQSDPFLRHRVRPTPQMVSVEKSPEPPSCWIDNFNSSRQKGCLVVFQIALRNIILEFSVNHNSWVACVMAIARERKERQSYSIPHFQSESRSWDAPSPPQSEESGKPKSEESGLSLPQI
jgi:hypothetical protein